MQISKYFSVTVAAIEGYEISDRNTRYRTGINSVFCEINGIFRGPPTGGTNDCSILFSYVSFGVRFKL